MDHLDAEKILTNADKPENSVETPDTIENDRNIPETEESDQIIQELQEEAAENTSVSDTYEMPASSDIAGQKHEPLRENRYRQRNDSDYEKPHGGKQYDYYDDDDDDEVPYVYNAKENAGDFVFKVLAGILIFAICITAVVAVLLATGHLNGLIDTLNENRAETAEAESMPETTPTVRVTLTPTPAATATPAPEPTATQTPAETPAKTPDSSKPQGTDGSAQDADVMLFNEVNDIVTAKEITNLRNVPSQGEESFIIHILQNGETVQRTGMSDEGWSRLEYEGQTVYAMSNLLTTDLTENKTGDSAAADESGNAAPVIQTQFEDVNEQVTPKIEVNLRLMPSVTNPNATVVAKIKNGEVVTRTGVNEELGWSRVEYKGQTLYCISSYVEVVPPAAGAQPDAAAAPAA